MSKLYLVETPNRSLPEGEDLTQIKGKSSGDLAICYGDSTHELVSEQTFEETQTILDAWINEENTEIQLDPFGNELLKEEQSKIDLAKIMENI